MWKSLPTLTWLAGAAFTVGALAATNQAAEPPGSASTVAEQSAAPTRPAPAPTTPTPGAGETTEPPEAEAPATVLRRADTDLGVVVTDGKGRTLYLSTVDDNRPARSKCYGQCAKLWPPLTVKPDGKVVPEGVDPNLIGVLKREDGTIQVTLNGWPLYWYVRDRAQGDVRGEGYRNSWHAIGPKGKPAAG
jgi:predicted lipoprotein with Yx(FWY)xxD motif